MHRPNVVNSGRTRTPAPRPTPPTGNRHNAKPKFSNGKPQVPGLSLGNLSKGKSKTTQVSAKSKPKTPAFSMRRPPHPTATSSAPGRPSSVSGSRTNRRSAYSQDKKWRQRGGESNSVPPTPRDRPGFISQTVANFNISMTPLRRSVDSATESASASASVSSRRKMIIFR